MKMMKIMVSTIILALAITGCTQHEKVSVQQESVAQIVVNNSYISYFIKWLEVNSMEDVIY